MVSTIGKWLRTNRTTGLSAGARSSPSRGEVEIEAEHQQDAGEKADPQLGRVDVPRSHVDMLGTHARSPRPRGVERLFWRSMRRTGTCSWNRSRSRFTRKRRYASSTACGRLHWMAMLLGRTPTWFA